MRWLLPMLLLAGACNPDPGEIIEGVGYRDGSDGTWSGERGNISISEALWSGSVTNDGTWDPSDVFVELRNEGTRPVSVQGWQLTLEGTNYLTWIFPEGPKLDVGEHMFVAAKTSGCFPEPDWVIPGLEFPTGDAFRLTLRDMDERLINGMGSTEMPPFAGGYDLVLSRSMEQVELMFSGTKSLPGSWHHYTDAPVPADLGPGEIDNRVNIADRCRERTLASPGIANSPDYSGAFATGSFD